MGKTYNNPTSQVDFTTVNTEVTQKALAAIDSIPAANYCPELENSNLDISDPKFPHNSEFNDGFDVFEDDDFNDDLFFEQEAA